MKKLTPLIASLAAAASLNAGIVILDEAQSFIISEDNLLKVVSDATLSNSDEYVLPGQLFVTSDATLTINAGVVMRGIPGAQSPFSSGSGYTGGSLIVSRDGQIDAEGTKAAPIIFTTAALKNSDGVPDTSVDYSDTSVFSGKTTADFWDTKSTTAATGTSDAMPPLKLTDDSFDMTGDISGDAATATKAYQKMWGGVVILGSAPTSIGRISGSAIYGNNSNLGNKALASVTNEPYEGQIEGLVSTDIGELSAYGGRNPNDSSGTFKFVSIRHGGEEIGTANEINGLTLGGVGAGTLLEYVEIYSNNDDGFEFFGGTVNTRYLVVTTVADDSFDIDEGFTGLGQFWFSFQADDQYNGDQSGEHDGTKANFSSLGHANIASGSSSQAGLTLTFPTVYNATYVGGGLYGNRVQDSKSNQLFTIRDGFGGAYFNSIFSDARDGAVAVSTDGEGRFTLGDVIFRSNVWYGNNAAFATAAAFQATGNGTSGDRSGTNDKSFDIYNQTGSAFANNVFTSDPWAASNRVSGADTVTYEGQIARRNYASVSYSYGWDHGGFDPAEVTAAVTGLNLEPYTATFFIDAGYAGAFNPQADALSQDLWTEGWTAFDKLFYQDR
jgi:hypothetical protein